MNFIEVKKLSKAYLTIPIFFAILFLVSLYLFFNSVEAGSSEASSSLPFSFLVFSLVVFLVSLFKVADGITAGFYGKRQKLALKQLENTYGISISSLEMESLKYPFMEPKDDFRLFGDFRREVKDENNRLSNLTYCLYWEDNQMHLGEKTNYFGELRKLPVKNNADSNNLNTSANDKTRL